MSEFLKGGTTHYYSKGSTLFVEGQPSNGVFVLESGRVKLLAYSEEGRAIITRIAEPGEALGLPACVAGVSYEVTARLITDCRVRFIRHGDLLIMLRKDHKTALGIIRALSRLYHASHFKICSLGLSTSASDKLSKLFLHWSERTGIDAKSASIRMNFTHEELAEMIGTSRETVTRLIKSFKTRKLITLEGSTLTIPDKAALRETIGNRRSKATARTAAP